MLPTYENGILFSKTGRKLYNFGLDTSFLGYPGHPEGHPDSDGHSDAGHTFPPG